jgi:DNA-binding NarL/FixJ family response regulator
MHPAAGTPHRDLDVLIVCRAELLLLGLERLLSREGDLRVFTYARLPGAAARARREGRPPATALARRRPARLALLCARQAPDLVGEVEESLASLVDEVVVLLDRPDADLMVAAMRAGARCFAMEGDPPDVLVATLRAAARGHVHMGPRTIETLVDWLGGRERARAGADDRDLLRLLAEGRTTQDIAGRLGIAPKTVRNRLSKLYRALGVHSRAAAVRIAEERGLLE